MNSAILINDFYNFIGVDKKYQGKEVVSVCYDCGTQLDLVLNEAGFIKIIISKRINNLSMGNLYLEIMRKNLPTVAGDSSRMSLTQDNQLIVWLRVSMDDLTLVDLLNVMQKLHIEIYDIINKYE